MSFQFIHNNSQKFKKYSLKHQNKKSSQMTGFFNRTLDNPKDFQYKYNNRGSGNSIIIENRRLSRPNKD